MAKVIKIIDNARKSLSYIAFAEYANRSVPRGVLLLFN